MLVTIFYVLRSHVHISKLFLIKLLLKLPSFLRYIYVSLCVCLYGKHRASCSLLDVRLLACSPNGAA